MNDSRQELRAIQDYLKQKPPRKYDERRIYYVYMHSNWNTERGELGCRYIGKGKGKRAWSRLNRNVHWRRIFTLDSQPDISFFVSDVDEETAFEIEKWMIADARAAGIKLCNMTEGGDGVIGYIYTEEVKKKMSQARIGVKRTPHTEETKRKIGDANRGKKNTPEACLKKSIAAKIRGARPEIKEIMRKASQKNIGSHRTEEQCKNIREAVKASRKLEKEKNNERIWIKNTELGKTKWVGRQEIQLFLDAGWTVGRLSWKWRVNRDPLSSLEK